MEKLRRVILDSSVLIGHLRGKEEGKVISKLEGQSELATTTINAFELYYGAYKSKESRKNLAAAKGLLSTLPILTLNESSSEKAGEILAGLESKGVPIDIKDILIGSIALEEGFSVLTHNKQHFERISGLHAVDINELAE